MPDTFRTWQIIALLPYQPVGCLTYCKFTVILVIGQNFIFMNIREFDYLQIQHSHKAMAYVELTKGKSCITNFNLGE